MSSEWTAKIASHLEIIFANIRKSNNNVKEYSRIISLATEVFLNIFATLKTFVIFTTFVIKHFSICKYLIYFIFCK